MRIVVIGAGLAGRLVQIAVPDAQLFDWRKQVPDYADLQQPQMLGAQYLWRSIPGIDSTPIHVRTRIDLAVPTPETIVAYKKKVGKADDNGDWLSQFQDMPGHVITRMPLPDVRFNSYAQTVDINRQIVRFRHGDVPYDYLVSTVPFYALLKLLGSKFPFEPQYRAIYIRTTKVSPIVLPPATWMVNYWSRGDTPLYRSTYRNGETHDESLSPVWEFGYRRIVPGKIYCTPEQAAAVQEIQEYLACQHIFTFGRYGSWQPDELLHHTWERVAAWVQSIKPLKTSVLQSFGTNAPPSALDTIA